MDRAPGAVLPLMPLLIAGDVQVWSASLDQPIARLNEFAAMLAPDERQRANEIVHDINRRRFVAGRGMLRALLSRYVHRPPAHIVIAYGAHGKPEIVGDGRAGIHFNVSHSCDRVVYAVARGRRVGIDVERMRQVASLSRIARRYFSPSEHLALQALPEDRRVAAFFRCWTRKEALVKASGDGVSHAIHRLDVEMCDSARSMNIAGWVLDDLPTDEGYVAAVAVEAHA